ncbi:MAG TPA: endonuclease MutS2, partial [Polyangiaceae bacterium]|nr:endonuclease MutS2 [Polyangiaceae bacterium]
MLWAIRDRCVGPLGRKLALALPFAQTRDEARTWLSQSAEATRTLQEGRPVPLIESEGIHEAIERVRVGGVLAPVELRALGRMLDGARTLRRFLTSRKVELPTLFTACATDPSLDG